MKLVSVIKKNFKLLLRNKTSAIVVLLGPLLIILLIGLAFNNAGSDYTLTIGVYSESHTTATDTFISGLEEKYDVNEFESEETCVNSVKKGTTNVCIIFPKDLVLDDETQDEIQLYVDESRINLVDTVIGKISSIIGVSAESTSRDLTSSLLTTVSLTKTELESNLFRAVNIKQNTESLISDADAVSSDISAMDLDVGSVSLSSIDSNVDSLYSKADSIKDDALDAITDALEIIDDELGDNSTEYLAFQDYYADINDSDINASYQTVISKIDDASGDLDDLEDKLSTADTKRTNIVSKIGDIKSDLGSVKSDITQLKTSLESISSSISEIKVFSAESIVNPITTIIKPVGTSAQKSTYLIPSLLILIIMFIGIMLSGTSIIIDKMSSASFRTFTAPTRDSFYLISYYITNIIILLIQILVIGGLALYFLKFSTLANLPLTLLIVFLACSLFIFIGMGFGYMFKSQEGVTIASLSFASILLFVSNLIIPLETTPILVQQIARYNPYMILSDILKKVMIFNVGILEIIGDVALIFVYIIFVFIFILIIQKLSKMIYFKKIPHIRSKRLVLTTNQYFKLPNGKLLKDKRDLLKFLEHCSNDEFREFVDHERNKFAVWVRAVLNDKKLAKKIKKVTDKDKIIKIVEENVARGATNRKF